MDLEQELRHLAEADEHVSNGSRLISRLEATVSRLQEDGRDTSIAARSLEALRQAQVTFLEHRDTIAQTIRDIEAGRL